MDKLILVYYIGTAMISEDMIESYVKLIIKKIKSDSNIIGEIIVIPTKEIDTRIECINPKYITEPELIREHRLKMDELHEYFNYYINEFKKENKNGE